MAPEQLEGDVAAIGPATDIYQLGTILYELLTSSLPFPMQPMHLLIYSKISTDPVSPRDRNPSVNPELASLCLKALKKSPADRFSSMADFATQLETCLARGLRPMPTPLPPRRWWQFGR